MDDLARLLRDQAGVTARRQALEVGMTPIQVARALRRREWVIVHRGVYVDHTGPLTWHQRSWAAVLSCAPAALCGASAKRAYDGPGRPGSERGPVHVAVDRDRHVEAPDGVVVHRMSDLEARVHWNLGPPRVRYEHTVLDLAAAARDELAAVAVLADACGVRRTTADRLLTTMAERRWIAGRDFLRGVLSDIREGTCSVLEHGYLTRVERPHGLPLGRRQAERVMSGRRILQDVEYGDLGLVVELDGVMFHGSVEQRDHDLDRDLDRTVTRDGTTLRLGYGQVFRRGCHTAAQVARVMQRLGWPGDLVRCAKCGGPDQPG
ncbi:MULTISPECIES: type IV toxin-antitoxin system AbiEi family antitoxin domain-containing protein [unclassified Nocardioides]|uniref:type IV toxin-antitoxin system AbiEi family antitoxin domain-containing protein n=1 Tax=unclassified Nocardioides TaxID=2615069 RepID=UPI00361C62FF